MPENKKKPSRLDEWFSQPYRPRGTKLLAWLILAMSICAIWIYYGMDNDSYYMIPQGNEILSSGIPEYNNFTYHNAKIVVQQWLYCIAIALADKIPYNLGLMAFMLVQALFLFALIERYVRKATKDRFWSWLATIIICVVSSLNYFTSLRPENITLILLFLQCMALDAYRETKHKRYLLALPLILVAEANLHISLWPAHACVYAAYFVPALFPWIQDKLQAKHENMPDLCPGILINNGMVPDPWLYGFSILSLACLFLNPYGASGVMYLFNSTPVFNLITIAEQVTPYLVSPSAVKIAMLALLLAFLIAKKRMDAVGACMSAGFIFLATLNHHNSMFLPLAIVPMAKALLSWLESKNPARAVDLMPNGVKSILYMLLAVACMASIAITIPGTPDYKLKPGLDPVVDYLLENQQPGDAILNNLNAGSQLEHAGLKNLFGDTRPELLMPSIAKTDENNALVFGWLCSGAQVPEIYEKYPDIESYLDAKNVQFIVDEDTVPVMPYLAGWLESSPDWEKAVTGSDEIQDKEKYNAKAYCVWVRTDRTGDRENQD